VPQSWSAQFADFFQEFNRDSMVMKPTFETMHADSASHNKQNTKGPYD